MHFAIAAPSCFLAVHSNTCSFIKLSKILISKIKISNVTIQGINLGLPRTNQYGVKIKHNWDLALYTFNYTILQLNLSTTGLQPGLGTEESGHCKEVAIVERF